MELTINKEYADKYNKWREKEELQKLKDRYGDVENNESSSSSSESEDENAEGLTPGLEKDWLKTLAAIKSRDPKIYNKDVQFYQTESSTSSDQEAGKSSKTSSKPMFLKDYERKMILEKDGKFSDDDSSSGNHSDENKPGYYEEQEEIRKSIQTAVDSSSDSEDEFLTKRKKTKQQLQKEEADYLDWLKGEKDELNEEEHKAGVELSSLKEYWSDPKLSENEKFLRDYLLNKRYLMEDEDLPTYDEILEEEDFSDEETQLEMEEDFERKYNFRFEDPDPEFIKTYPRTVVDTVRRKDTKRLEKRKEIKERKRLEKEKRKEEIKQLKNLKKKEIESQIDRLKEVAGVTDDPKFSNVDLEGDFDPEAHDKMMKKLFSKNYYNQDEDDEKPTWSDDEGMEISDWDKWTGGATSEPTDELSIEDEQGTYDIDQSYDYQEGDDFDHDENEATDAFPDTEDRELNATKKKRKKSKFQQVVEAKKPVFEPGEKSFATYLDEYYKLDCEDIVAGQPCRFKYRNVVSNTFGLTTDEVMAAKEGELNRWVSLKKMSQYRTEEEEKFDVKIFDKKGRNTTKKLNVLMSLKEDDQEDTTELTQQQQQQRKDKKKKKRNKKTAFQGEPDHDMHAGTDKLNDPSANTHGHVFMNDGSQGTSDSNYNERSLSKEHSEKPRSPKKIIKDVTQVNQTSESLTNNETKKTKKKLKNKQDNKTSLNFNRGFTKSKNKITDKKEKHKKKKVKIDPSKLSEERLKAYGIDPIKYRRRKKEKNKQN